MASHAASICTGVLFTLVLTLATPAAWSQGDPNGVWSTLSPSGAGPGARYEHGAIYDPIGDRMIVVGGAESLEDTWMLSLGASPQWTNLNANLPGGRKAMAVIYDPVRRRGILFGGYGTGSFNNDVWALDLAGSPVWTELHPPGGPPSGRMFTLAVYDPLRDRMIVFGGHPGPLNDVWALSLAAPAWTQLNPAGTAPSPRYGHVGVYDPVGDRLVIFGGSSGGDEAWALSLSGTPTWTQLAPPDPRPPSLLLATAVYDAVGRRMIVYGGHSGAISGDAWALTLDGTGSWQQLVPDGLQPSARYRHVAVYQQSMNRMVVFGGDGGGADVPILEFRGPAITSFAPAGGRIGDAVQVFGSVLRGATEVAFNGIPAPIVENSSARILTNVPVGASTGPITVTTAYGTTSSADSFFVGETPEMSSAVPDSGKVSTVVTISGAHFGGATRVAFGLQSHASFTVDSDQQITAIVDELAQTGPISVTTPAATGTSSFIFNVLPVDTAARIVNVRDVRADQGGRVAVRWLRSDLDVAPRREIAGYRVWRRAPLDLAATATTPHPTWRREVTLAGEVVFWEPLTVIPASYLEGYALVAPTTRDSIENSNPYTAFFIQTLTADPFVFYNSAVDSGYSVDNLPPRRPPRLTAEYRAPANLLHWGGNLELDLWEYRLYRGSELTFVPGPDNLVYAGPDTMLVDSGSSSSVYKLSAVDIHGNESRFALATPGGSTTSIAFAVVARAEPTSVTLEWYAIGLAGTAMQVHRRTEGASWQAIGTVISDAVGMVSYRDDTVQPGQHLGYRLGMMDGDVEVFSDETWVTVPEARLALLWIMPNPVVSGAGFLVRLSLPQSVAATLQVLDISGRVVARHDLRSLAAGVHEVRIAWERRPAPGIYWVRLTQAGSSVAMKVGVLR